MNAEVLKGRYKERSRQAGRQARGWMDGLMDSENNGGNQSLFVGRPETHCDKDRVYPGLVRTIDIMVEAAGGVRMNV